MFYPVKITDNKGKVKKVLPSKKLSKDYWDSYFDGLNKKVPLHLKKKAAKTEPVLPSEDLDVASEKDEYSLE